MQKQATVQRVVTLEKNQDKTQKNIQKIIVSQQQQQQNLQRPQKQQHLLREHNICQDQQHLSIKFFNRASDNKTAKNVIPEGN